MSLLTPFSYPSQPHVRRHAPAGYDQYITYKPWLRDEFEFRCVYCLRRESWSDEGQNIFSVDHIIPQADDALGDYVCEYTNLVYACIRCNSARKNAWVLDPTDTGFNDHLRFLPDGTLAALSGDGLYLIRLLHLNSDNRVRGRLRILRALARYVRYPKDLDVRRDYFELFGYPEDLPELRRRPPHGPDPPDGNRLAVNTNFCHAARRERGELPLVYSVGECPRLPPDFS